jgi:hypothetical protein
MLFYKVFMHFLSDFIYEFEFFYKNALTLYQITKKIENHFII